MLISIPPKYSGAQIIGYLWSEFRLASDPSRDDDHVQERPEELPSAEQHEGENDREYGVP